MEDFRILDPDPDPDPYNNSTGSASLPDPDPSYFLPLSEIFFNYFIFISFSYLKKLIERQNVVKVTKKLKECCKSHRKVKLCCDYLTFFTFFKPLDP